MGSFLVYAGMAVAGIGFISLLRPLRFLRIQDRRAALGVFLAGIGFAILGALWPAPKVEVAGRRKALDELLWEYHFHEIHSLRIHASPQRVFQAIREVRPEEIRYLVTLMAIRSLPQRLLAGDGPPQVVPGYRLESLQREDRATRWFVTGKPKPAKVPVTGRSLSARYESQSVSKRWSPAEILAAYRDALSGIGGRPIAQDGCCRETYRLERGSAETYLEVAVDPDSRSFRLAAVETRSMRNRSMLAALSDSGFLSLRDVPDRDLVLGIVERFGPAGQQEARFPRSSAEFASFEEPGYAKIGFDFHGDDTKDGWTQLSTETRILATDEAARWRFGIYWSLIHPGSALIRRSWLEAIRQRAESPRATPKGAGN
jgi:hypothetical protein